MTNSNILITKACEDYIRVEIPAPYRGGICTTYAIPKSVFLQYYTATISSNINEDSEFTSKKYVLTIEVPKHAHDSLENEDIWEKHIIHLTFSSRRKAKQTIDKIWKCVDGNVKRSFSSGDRRLKRWSFRIAAVGVSLAAIYSFIVHETVDPMLNRIDPAKTVQISPVNMENVRIAGQLAGIQIPNVDTFADDAVPFYIFTRPNCEQCASVDSVLDKVDPHFKPIVLPASFEADIESARGVAASYCSKDPGEKWLNMAKGRAVDLSIPDQCDDWKFKAQISSGVAALLAIADSPDDWPLVVAPNGRVTRGGYPSYRGETVLTDFLKENLQ